jgi:hypothetical protein
MISGWAVYIETDWRNTGWNVKYQENLNKMYLSKSP